jgi:hypothetical protein
MSKKLIKICILVFCLCAVGSSLMNHRTASTVKKNREIAIIDNADFHKNNWVAILEAVPQYKNPELEQPVDSEVKVVHISDGQIIGIIAGKPYSVLIYINNSEAFEPLQLKVGEGWLPNWKIKQINPDSVFWVNNLNQETYQQLLFNDKNTKPRKLTSEISRIK